MNPEKSQSARSHRQNARRRGFFIHASVFLAVNLTLIGINTLTASGHPWSVFPLLGWGFGLSMHGLSAFGAFGHLYRARCSQDCVIGPAA